MGEKLSSWYEGISHHMWKDDGRVGVIVSSMELWLCLLPLFVFVVAWLFVGEWAIVSLFYYALYIFIAPIASVINIIILAGRSNYTEKISRKIIHRLWFVEMVLLCVCSMVVLSKTEIDMLWGLVLAPAGLVIALMSSFIKGRGLEIQKNILITVSVVVALLGIVAIFLEGGGILQALF